MQRFLLLFGLLVIGLGAGCGYRSSASNAGDAPTQAFATMQKHGVRVSIALERDRDGGLVLASTYTPDDPTSHLYSTGLPRGGIDGIGRPTLLELPVQPGVQAVGPVVADKQIVQQRVEGFSAPFPIYPDGSVTLRQPIQLEAGAHVAQIVVRISYMACSSRGYCMPPVVDKELALKLAVQ